MRGAARFTKCPACAARLHVYDVKRLRDGTRRRSFACAGCTRRYTSTETPITVTTSVAKRDGGMELFMPHKLERSLEAAAYKHYLPVGYARSVALETANALPANASTHGIAMQAARLVARRDPALAFRYLITCLDTAFEDLATTHGWVHAWATEKQHDAT